jgi:hypothetical protein
MNQSPVSFETFNMYKAVIKPDFKEVNKEFWRTEGGFSIKNPKKSLATSNIAATSEERKLGDNPYIAGLNEIGSQALMRRRYKDREVSPRPFESTVRSDNYRNEFVNIVSIGGGKSLEESIIQKLLSKETEAGDQWDIS